MKKKPLSKSTRWQALGEIWSHGLHRDQRIESLIETAFWVEIHMEDVVEIALA